MTARDYSNIPAELKALPQWFLAVVELKPDGKKRVIPKNARTLQAGSTTDSRTWSTFEVTLAKAKETGLELGFVFTKEDGLTGMDLDEPVDDAERANHERIYNSVLSYTELSWSGKGVHIIVKATIPHAVKRNHVEIYDWGRFFIMTGDHVAGRPTEVEYCNDVVNKIVEEAGGGRTVAIEHDDEEKRTDRDVYEQCLNSSNGDRFKELWDGKWQGNPKYPSQSEADFALINFIAFATHNNEQTRRMFRQSGLGKRPKADRDAYLDGMIGTIRAEQNPVAIDFSQFVPPPFVQEAVAKAAIDFSAFQAPPMVLAPKKIETDFKFPDGLVGEMAQYTHDSAIKPIPQVALAGALGLMSGMAGRTYNISNTGLNLYFLLIAGTAIGKEGAAQGMDRIMAAVTKKLPAAAQFIGPGEYASGQALVKQLEETPCYVSRMGEFGHMLKRICNPNAIGADVMWRKLFLELFNKSGPTDRLGKMVYSDQGKNTAEVASPAFSIVADSTASSVFENLSEETIEIGLIPRFMIIECADKRPPTNPNAWAPPSAALVAKVEALAITCLSMSANGTRCPITIEMDARRMLKDFDEEIDGHINAQNDDAVRQIWSRSYLKAMRVAGILAVGLNVDAPNVRLQDAEWAIKFAREDAQHMLRRFGDGVGGGDPEQIARLRTSIINILRSKQSSKKMSESGVVSHHLIQGRTYKLACFKTDRMGAGNALNRALGALMDNGEIIKLTARDTQEQFNTTAKCYWVTKSFQSR